MNPIENLWLILKQKLRTGGRRFTSKDDIWDEIIKSCDTVFTKKYPQIDQLNGKASVEGYGEDGRILRILGEQLSAFFNFVDNR